MPDHSLNDLPIRRLGTADLPACADLAEDRGWPRKEHEWDLMLKVGIGYAIDDPAGGLVSACVVTEYGPPALNVIGLLLVAGRHGRQGIGRRMMRHIIETSTGTPLTLFATRAGRPLYEQLGFTALGEVQTVRGHFAPTGLAPRIATRTATIDDVPEIQRLDAEVFGTDRTNILSQLSWFADTTVVAEFGSEIVGYAVAWPTAGTRVIGPVIARDTATAQALITHLAEGAAPVRANINTNHDEILDWLKASGLEPTERNTVMVYGIPDLPGDPTRRFSPLTLAAG